MSFETNFYGAETTLARRYRTALPELIDHVIFKQLSARYQPNFQRFSSNLHSDRQGVQTYLGTYFPRSYAESFCIFSQLLEYDPYREMLEALPEINILDFGCGTGGEIFGLFYALNKYLKTPKTITVQAIDGNQLALQCCDQIAQAVSAHHGFEQRLVLNTTFYEVGKSTSLEINADTLHMVLCNKCINELIQQGFYTYDSFVERLMPVLDEQGIMMILDLTHKLNDNEEHLCSRMARELNHLQAIDSKIKTLVPMCCNAYCSESECFHQQVFSVSHSHQQNDESKVAYRIMCHASLFSRLLGQLFIPVNAKLNLRNDAQPQLCNNEAMTNVFADSVLDAYDLKEIAANNTASPAPPSYAPEPQEQYSPYASYPQAAVPFQPAPANPAYVPAPEPMPSEPYPYMPPMQALIPPAPAPTPSFGSATQSASAPQPNNFEDEDDIPF